MEAFAPGSPLTPIAKPADSHSRNYRAKSASFPLEILQQRLPHYPAADIFAVDGNP